MRKIQFSAGAVQGNRPDCGRGAGAVWGCQHPYRGDISYQRRTCPASGRTKNVPQADGLEFLQVQRQEGHHQRTGRDGANKPMFRRSLLERRCIVPTTGFYEWDGQKRKYHFRLPGQDRLYLAGLWNTFQGEERFVILTTAPNDTIINVHDRMPVLLTDDEVTPWLHDTGMASAKLTALQPALEGAAV